MLCHDIILYISLSFYACPFSTILLHPPSCAAYRQGTISHKLHLAFLYHCGNALHREVDVKALGLSSIVIACSECSTLHCLGQLVTLRAAYFILPATTAHSWTLYVSGFVRLSIAYSSRFIVFAIVVRTTHRWAFFFCRNTSALHGPQRFNCGL